MNRWIVGIDEAGRGALAGPVSVGLCAIRKGTSTGWFQGVKDSKQLTHEKREEWLNILNERAVYNEKVRFNAVFVDNKKIDEEGISKCVRSGIEILLEDFPDNSIILLDGLLKAPTRFKNQTTIIKGDEKEPLIALASIAAKVSRDDYMIKLGSKTNYGFEVHKGYGTKKHCKLIRAHGVSSHHRQSYLSKIIDTINCENNA